jgi:hypothetical protein
MPRVKSYVIFKYTKIIMFLNSLHTVMQAKHLLEFEKRNDDAIAHDRLRTASPT